MDSNNSKLSITAFILTYNESKHIERCINSVKSICSRIVVVDSFSSDTTIDIARSLGAEIYEHPFVNHSDQIKWALENCTFNSEWIFRIDADEYITKGFENEILQKMPGLNYEITGLFVNIRVRFLDRIIRYGGHYPIKVVRLWRTDAGYIEPKFMDERIVLKHGRSIYFNSDLVDHNLHPLTWWTIKQNGYALREAADLLNQEFGIFETMNTETRLDDPAAQRKRRLKTGVYNKAPLFLRVFLYFIYRYIFRLGFLDGKAGMVWHFLQGFWLRFLVDSIIWQVKYISRTTNRDIKSILIEDYNLKIS